LRQSDSAQKNQRGALIVWLRTSTLLLRVRQDSAVTSAFGEELNCAMQSETGAFER